MGQLNVDYFGLMSNRFSFQMKSTWWTVCSVYVYRLITPPMTGSGVAIRTYHVMINNFEFFAFRMSVSLKPLSSASN